MNPLDLPKFSVTAIHDDRRSGRFDPSPFIDERAIGCIYIGAGGFVRGRFLAVDQARLICDFLPDDPDEAVLLRVGRSYPYLDSYWGDRAELVLDEHRTWQPTEFQPRDMTSTDGETTPGGWDHEHCSICWERIGSSGQATGFVSGRDWACEECYRRFVATRSVAFVTWQKGYNHPSES